MIQTMGHAMPCYAMVQVAQTTPSKKLAAEPPKRGTKCGYAVPADAREKETRTVKPRSKRKRCKQSTWA
eukprot:s450_g27.t1